MKPPRRESIISVQTTSRPSAKRIKMPEKYEIISSLFLNAIQAATIKKDPSNILVVTDNLTNYHQDMQTLSHLYTELPNSQQDNFDYAK
jgi:hypothetical protein